MSEEKHFECSFCGKQQQEVKRLIAGPSAYICDDCVELCASILKQEEIDEKEKNNPSPKKSANEIPIRLNAKMK